MSRLIEWRALVFVLAAMIAGSAPLVTRSAPSSPSVDAFPGWPELIEGRAVRGLPLSARETAFAQDFPGRIGRFTDGEREIILRWVASPTRRLHPAGDCFRGLGYKLSPQPMRAGANGTPMSCFRAVGRDDAFDVCEQITNSAGRSWPDVSSWYWHALWSGRSSAWWSMVIATPVPRAS